MMYVIQLLHEIANIRWIMENESSRKTCISANAKAFDCVDHNKLWKILKEMGIPYHLTCLLRNLYAPGALHALVWRLHTFTYVCESELLSPASLRG